MRTFSLIAFIFIPIVLIANSNGSNASIHQIIETRNGHKSCWGVTIYLNKLAFNKMLKSNEISIVETKHSHELKDIMTWRVDRLRKKLFIKFKKGCGDFGTGNLVTVTIQHTAFSEPPKEPLSLSINTDRR